MDGLALDQFEPGCLYDVGSALGCLFLAEGWAEPAVYEGPAPQVLLDETHTAADAQTPLNLIREKWPPYLDDLCLAANVERRRRG